MFEYSVGGASTHGPQMFWQEEGGLAGNPSVKRRGNLYLASEGPPAECLLALRAVRDQYYGDTAQAQGGNTAALRQSLEAANMLLAKRSGIGVSFVGGAVSEWGQLTLLRAGDCHAFIYSGQEGELQRIGERQSADKALGRRAEGQFAETKWVLKDKDILILCSGALVDSLAQEEMASVAVLYAGEGPEAIARRLVEKASLDSNGGISTAVVVMCRSTGAGIEPTLPLALGTGVGGRESAPRSLTPVPRLRPGLGDAGKMPFIAAAAAVIVAALLLARPLLSDISAANPAAPTPEGVGGQGAVLPTPDLRLPTLSASGGISQTTTDTPETMWTKVEDLWKKGEGGNMAAWQEIVSLLEQLQVRTSADQRVAGRLSIAKTNLVYGQRMQEATTYWGTGDTRAPTAGNWSRVVSALEGLLAYPLTTPLSSSQLSTARARLYSARMNYGKALEDAKRRDDARVQYERARELDPRRPEAPDALKRLSR